MDPITKIAARLSASVRRARAGSISAPNAGGATTFQPLESLEPRLLLSQAPLSDPAADLLQSTTSESLVAAPLVESSGIQPIPSLRWEELGPASATGSGVEGIPGSPIAGALQAVAIDPTDPNIMFVGSVNGGIWRSTNARDPTDGVDSDRDPANVVDGNTDADIFPDQVDDQVHWVPVADEHENLSVSDITFSPLPSPQEMSPGQPHQILYAGLGAFSSFADRGGTESGVLKSLNSGLTWTHIARGE
jgi:hypothetical protein